MLNHILLLTTADLKKVLRIKLEIEGYEQQLVAIHTKAKVHRKSSRSLQPVPLTQPPLRGLISSILRKAGKPLSVQEIYEATLLADYHWRSREPINALNVKLYTDRTFKKVAPGQFVLREP